MSQIYISQALRKETIAYFKRRCAYCRSPEELVWVFYEVDHIIPVAQGGPTIKENLALTCAICNRFKSDITHGTDPSTGRRTALYHPRRQNWFRHFAWSSDNLVIYGRTVCGRATVEAIQLNNARLIGLRKIWLRLGALPPNWNYVTEESE